MIPRLPGVRKASQRSQEEQKAPLATIELEKASNNVDSQGVYNTDRTHPVQVEVIEENSESIESPQKRLEPELLLKD